QVFHGRAFAEPYRHSEPRGLAFPPINQAQEFAARRRLRPPCHLTPDRLLTLDQNRGPTPDCKTTSGLKARRTAANDHCTAAIAPMLRRPTAWSSNIRVGETGQRLMSQKRVDAHVSADARSDACRAADRPGF